VGEYPDKRNSLLGRLFRKREKKRILMDSLLPVGVDKCGVFGLKLLAKSLVQTVKRPIE